MFLGQFILVKVVLQHCVLSKKKNELTFKGDFWVNDSTFAIKKINMAVTANINLKDIYMNRNLMCENDSSFVDARLYDVGFCVK
jgi:hypothetical protein